MFINKIKYKPKFFDFLLLISILSIIASLFIILFRTTKTITVKIKVSEDSVILPNKGIQTWFSNLFQKGMKEQDFFGRNTAVVTDVKRYDYLQKANDPVQQLRQSVYLTIKLNVIYSAKNKQFTYKGKNVLIGSTIQLYLDRMIVDGLIVDVEGFQKPYPVVKLYIDTQLINIDPAFPETQGTMPFVDENINIGDVVNDNTGHSIIEIVDKKTEEAKKIVTTASGDVLLRRDPIKKDVYLTMKTWAYKIGDRFYTLDYVPIVINNIFPAYFKTIYILPTIIGIKEIEAK